MRQCEKPHDRVDVLGSVSFGYLLRLFSPPKKDLKQRATEPTETPIRPGTFRTSKPGPEDRDRSTTFGRVERAAEHEWTDVCELPTRGALAGFAPAHDL